MQKDKYHHGNLQEALVSQGLLMLHEEGEEHLSLREVAKRCGVSPAAPYAHFKNKEAFVLAIQHAIMQDLTDQLHKTAKQHANDQQILTEMGLCYVLYFLQKPNYFSLLFGNSQHAQAVLWKEESASNPAFMALQQAATPIFTHFHIPVEAQHNILLAMWAMVHGLAAIVCVPDIARRLLLEPDKERRLRDILTAFSGPKAF